MTDQVSSKEIRDVYIKADLLFDESEVEQALRRMAFEITADLSDSNPIIMPVMNGGLVISGHLLTKLEFPLEVDYLHATRYRNTTSGNELEWKTYPNQPLQGRTIIVVDDIYDEGHTLNSVVNYLNEAGAARVIVAVLLNKNHKRKSHPELQLDYVGFEVEDRYVFGYGMDYKGYWRNAPGIFALKEKP
ncbi:MAG: hypoxanthine-guanine phosphoribosyltransferase [Neptuniibacter sp.]